MLKTPGVESIVSVNGFSLLSFAEHLYAFFFVTLKDWDKRTSTGRAVQGDPADIAPGTWRH